MSAERDYMRLHVGRRSWLIHHSMAALEEGLDPELFVRLHRSAIVRKDFIAGFTRNPSGPVDRPARRRDRAAGWPALFGPGPGDRRTLTKENRRAPGDARRFEPPGGHRAVTISAAASPTMTVPCRAEATAAS